MTCGEVLRREVTVIDTVGQNAVDADRAVGCLLGLAVGDALGTTLEFTARDTRPAVTELVGGGPFGLRPGEWTDDTSMALCLAESLIASTGDLDPVDLMRRFTGWYRAGENSVTGRCFDIGTITRSALERFERTGKTAASLRPDPEQAGNGTLMRLAPVALVAAPDLARAADLAEAQSRTTHGATLAHEACGLFATLLVEAMTGRSKEDVLRPRSVEGALAAVAAGSWRTKSRDEISSSGYVLDTLEVSLWCVDHTETFADAVCLAANLGDDADTVAAVTGQLAGALYGRRAIPEGWLRKLAWRERIETIGEQLLSIGRKRAAGHEAGLGLPTSSRNRFTWHDDDVVLRDASGAVITPRQALEQQLARRRADIAETRAELQAAEPTPPAVLAPARSASRREPKASLPPATDKGLNAETLLNLGFADLASWVPTGDEITYQLDGPHADANRVRLTAKNSLYAFVRGEEVLYIGKTARTIRKRFVGYCRPAGSQSTNWRCNRNIKAAVERGEEIRVFVFTPISHLRYGVFDLNVAAGLEDALIAEFDPPWNGRDRGVPISEEAEREEADEGAATTTEGVGDLGPDTAVSAQDEAGLATFEIKLGQAYYEQGLINPGVEASAHLGRDGEPIEVSFDDGTEPVMSNINRTANRTGAVRVVGRNRQIAQWFQGRFQRGDTVQARVIDPHRIMLLSRDQGSK